MKHNIDIPKYVKDWSGVRYKLALSDCMVQSEMINNHSTSVAVLQYSSKPIRQHSTSPDVSGSGSNL